MTHHLPVAGASARAQSATAASTHARRLSTAVPSQAEIKLPPTRVKIELSTAFLNSCRIHQDWARFWLLVPEEVDTVADLLAALWRLLLIDVNPQVKLSCQGYYIPTSSSVEILREGDVVLVQLWSEEAAGDLPTNGKVLAPKTPIPKGPKQVTLKADQQLSGATGAENSKGTRIGPSRNARRKKLKRQLRREGVLPPKAPKSPQVAVSPAHAVPKDAHAKNHTAAVGSQRCVNATPHGTQTPYKSAAASAAAVATLPAGKPCAAKRTAAQASLPVENSKYAAQPGMHGGKKRSRQDEAACKLHTSAKGTTVAEQNSEGIATWTAFLSRTTAGHGTAPQQHQCTTPLARNQVAQESSSSEVESGEDEDSSEESSDEEQPKTKGAGQVRGAGVVVPGKQHPASNKQAAKAAAGDEESSEEETDDSSDEEEESEESSSSEEDEGAGAKGSKGAAELAAIAAQATNGIGVPGADAAVTGKGAGQGLGLHVPGSKKQGSDKKPQQEEDEEMEASDASGRFASAVEPWLAAQSPTQASPDKSEQMTSPAMQAQQHTRFEDAATGAATQKVHTDQELRQLIAETDKKEDLVKVGGSLPLQVVEGCVLMYRVAELNSAYMPSVSEWRLGRVHSTTATACTSQAGDPAGAELQMAPWPDEAVHPLRRAWDDAENGCVKVTCTGKGRGRNLDSDEACDAWIQGSMHYDPLTGWFSGLWAMDVVNAKLVQPAASQGPSTAAADQLLSMQPHDIESNVELPSPQTQPSNAGPSCTAGLPGPPAAPAAAGNTMGATHAASHSHPRDATAQVEKDPQEALKETICKDVPVATVQPDAEASLAEALGLLDSKPARQRKHRQRKKHNDKAATPTPQSGQQGCHVTSAVPLTPALAGGFPHGAGSNTAPVGHGALAPTPPMSSANPYGSPQDLLQALQQLEERKAELLESSQFEGKVAKQRIGTGGLQAHSKGTAAEAVQSTDGAQAMQIGGKGQRCHSADIPKAEHGGHGTKGRGARQALGGRRQSAMAPTLKLLRQSPSSLAT